MTAAIEIERVSKGYPIYDSPSKRLWELLTFSRKSFHREFWALRDLDVTIRRGEGFALLGANGSGKSTLLQLIAGILEPNSGSINVTGRIAALLELGSGFNPEFSGRENVILNAAILGLTTREIEERLPLIESFASIGEFIDQPVRTYSSGMAVRLGFAVAVHCEPEILLVDEALAVGDLAFRERCLARMKMLQRTGTTIILVSHSPQDVRNFCERALWLDQGIVRQIGPAARVMDEYLAAMAERDQRYARIHHERDETTGELALIPNSLPNLEERHGDGSGEFLGVALLDERGQAVGQLQCGRTATLRLAIAAHRAIYRPVVGFTLRNYIGVEFSGTDTNFESCTLAAFAPGDRLAIDFHLDIPELYPSAFSFSIWLIDDSEGGRRICDSLQNVLTIPMVSGGRPIYGYIHVPCRVDFHDVEGTNFAMQGVTNAEVA